MARLPRLVLPGCPYHVTQRGNRRQQTFFGDEDYALYRDLLAQVADDAGTEIWTYRLMPNHVHLNCASKFAMVRLVRSVFPATRIA